MRSYMRDPVHRARKRKRDKVYREQNKDKLASWRDTFYTPVKNREYNLKRYGLTFEQFEAMHKEQKGLCFICGRPPQGRGRNEQVLHIDHDHGSGRVRKLLCSRCNKVLGFVKDDPALLLKMVQYLQNLTSLAA